jgi:hypothetical protein
MQPELYSLSGVADLLAVKPHRILYLLSTRAVPEPQLRVAGKRLWTLEEIAVLSERLKLQTAAQLQRERGTHE